MGNNNYRQKLFSYSLVVLSFLFLFSFSSKGNYITNKIESISLLTDTIPANTTIHLYCGPSKTDPTKVPLIIVDGKEIPNDALKNITPSQIESITVLKGKEAFGLYGEKAKNGVILISLKKPLITFLVIPQ